MAVDKSRLLEASPGSPVLIPREPARALHQEVGIKDINIEKRKMEKWKMRLGKDRNRKQQRRGDKNGQRRILEEVTSSPWDPGDPSLRGQYDGWDSYQRPGVAGPHEAGWGQQERHWDQTLKSFLCQAEEVWA